eukprot:2584801-Rhodomonas_salina.1
MTQCTHTQRSDRKMQRTHAQRSDKRNSANAITQCTHTDAGPGAAGEVQASHRPRLQRREDTEGPAGKPGRGRRLCEQRGVPDAAGVPKALLRAVPDLQAPRHRVSKHPRGSDGGLGRGERREKEDGCESRRGGDDRKVDVGEFTAATPQLRSSPYERPTPCPPLTYAALLREVQEWGCPIDDPEETFEEVRANEGWSGLRLGAEGVSGLGLVVQGWFG